MVSLIMMSGRVPVRQTWTVRQEDRLSLDHNKRLRLAESINAWPSLGPTHSHAQRHNLPKSL